MPLDSRAAHRAKGKRPRPRCPRECPLHAEPDSEAPACLECRSEVKDLLSLRERRSQSRRASWLRHRAKLLRETSPGPLQSPPAPGAPAARGRPKHPLILATELRDALWRSASRKASRPPAVARRSILSPARSLATASSRASPLRSAARPRRKHGIAPDSLAVAALAPWRCAPRPVSRSPY